MNKSNKLFNYEIIKKLGQGSFGQVLLATKDGKKVAIKKLSKKQIIKVNKLHEPFIEKEILYKLNDLCKNLPFFIKIYETESDQDHMYLMIEYCSGGTLQSLVLNETLSPDTIKKIAAKLLLILEKLHELKVVHRDLKPSNFLLNERGEIKLSDFGTAYAPDSFFGEEIATKIKNIKQMNQQKEEKQKKAPEITAAIEAIDQMSLQDRRSTFVGTACYMAPELLANDVCGKEADIWAYGCILYQMTFKVSPFFDTSEGMVWKKILNNEIEIEATSGMKQNQQVLKLLDLIRKILIKDIDKRLGSGPNGYKDLKKHPYFQGIDWEKQAVGGIQEISQKVQQSRVSEINILAEKQVEKVILSGVVNKKMFFGNFKQRMLILYSTPKLVYYCTQTGDKKGQIPLLKQTPIGLDGKIFTISNEKKTYYFKSKTSAEWAEMIKNAILNAYY